MYISYIDQIIIIDLIYEVDWIKICKDYYSGFRHLPRLVKWLLFSFKDFKFSVTLCLWYNVRILMFIMFCQSSSVPDCWAQFSVHPHDLSLTSFLVGRVHFLPWLVVFMAGGFGFPPHKVLVSAMVLLCILLSVSLDDFTMGLFSFGSSFCCCQLRYRYLTHVFVSSVMYWHLICSVISQVTDIFHGSLS
jgi:hypothetical protein